MLAQLNSLANPLLYCYGDHRFKNAVLELLRIEKRSQISVCKRRRRESIASLEFGELQGRTTQCTNNAVICVDVTSRRSSDGLRTMMEERMSALSSEDEEQQGKTIILVAQTENAPGISEQSSSEDPGKILL